MIIKNGIFKCVIYHKLILQTWENEKKRSTLHKEFQFNKGKYFFKKSVRCWYFTVH